MHKLQKIFQLHFSKGAFNNYVDKMRGMGSKRVRFCPRSVKMFLKPVWVGKIHGVEVYATHVVRIWWFSNNFSIFQLKRM